MLVTSPSFAESNEAIAPRSDAPGHAFTEARRASSPPTLLHRTSPLFAPQDVLWLDRGSVGRFELELPALVVGSATSDLRPRATLSSLGIDLESAVPPLLRYETKDSHVSLLLAPGAGCTAACLKLEGVF